MSAFEAREEAHTTFIHVFALQDAARQPIDLQARGPALAEALPAVGAG